MDKNPISGEDFIKKYRAYEQESPEDFIKRYSSTETELREFQAYSGLPFSDNLFERSSPDPLNNILP